MEAGMILKSLGTAIAALILVTISAPVPVAKAQSNAADETAIKKVVPDFNTCFNSKNARACAMLFSEDGELTTVRGDIFIGRSDLEKHYQTVFTAFLKDAHRTDTFKSVRFLTPTIASVDAAWKMTGATSPNATEVAPPVREGILTWILTKHDGQWYITIFHELDFPGK
jgi:uncharacterized protein (TIGR02246 family)